jgi:signal transduction histidine kinase
MSSGVNGNTWLLVAFGFGAMLVLGAAVTVVTLGSISDMRRSVLGLTDAHQDRREQIERLRSQIYVSSILIRDRLLDRTQAETTYRDQLQENRAAALKQLEALSRLSSMTSDSAIKSLTAELEGYWQSLEMLIQDTAATPSLSPYEHIRTRIIPRRQAVIALAEELADTGAAEARASRQAVVGSIDAFRQYSLLLRIVTTVLALALALFTTVRVFRLEKAATAEHARVERAEEEMRHLSQKVLTSQEHERRSLSRELHDHVGQLVTSLRFGLSELERQCTAPSKGFSETLGQCRLMLEQTIEAVRGLAMGLRPSMLDDLGLAAAIEWQAREFSKRYNVPVTVNVEPTLANWPEPQRTVLYRVSQEALTNCARHAQATSVRIDLLRSGEFVSLSIRDDGVGIPPGQRPRGFGLLGMDERVREIGGKLNVRSPESGGTMLEVLLPLTGDPAHA